MKLLKCNAISGSFFWHYIRLDASFGGELASLKLNIVRVPLGWLKAHLKTTPKELNTKV